MIRWVALTVSAIAFGATVTSAYAATTRAEYVAQVDPICESTQRPIAKAFVVLGKAEARRAGGTERLFELARHPHRFLRLMSGPLTNWMASLNRIYGGVTSRVAAIPAAPGDEAAVATWLQKRTQVADFAARSIEPLRHRKLNRYVHLFGEAQSASTEAGQLASGLGIPSCTGRLSAFPASSD